MSKIWVTMLDGSTKGIVRTGLAQQRIMLTGPSFFFCNLFLVSRFFFPFFVYFFGHDQVGASKFGIQHENDCDDSTTLEGSNTS